MSTIKMFEAQGVVQTPRDGAFLNFHSIGKQNGRLSGAILYQVTEEQIQLTPGVLMIRGYRVFIDNYEIIFDKTLTPAPTVNTKYHIIFKISASTDDAVLEMLVSETPPQYGAKIEQVVGMYDYLLGTFYYGPNGISQFKSTILDINTTVAQDPESGEGQYELAENKIDLWSDGFSGPGSNFLFPTERLVKEGLNTIASELTEGLVEHIQLKAWQATEASTVNTPYYNTTDKQVYVWNNSDNRWEISGHEGFIYKWSFSYYKFTTGEGLTLIGADTPYDLQKASANTRGGIKASTKGETDTVEVKIDVASEKLFVPTYPVIPANKSYSKTITTANWTDKKYAVTISGLEVSDTVLLSGADDIFTTNGLTATITANTLTFEVETLPTVSIEVNFTVIKTEGGTL